MIAHGDELGRTQLGNNNTYAQDSELSWIHWLEADEPLVEFTASVARLRRQHPTFRRRRFFDGRPVTLAEGEPLPDIVWMTPAGQLMKPEDWDAGFGRSIGMFLNGNGIRGMDTRGSRVVDDSFLLLFNAHDEGMDWVLPPEEFAPAWRLVIDTSGVPDLPETIAGGGSVAVASKGMVVLQAMAAVHEPVHQGQAAADVPTIAPVPVPMRAESGATVSDAEPEPIEPEGRETQASEPDQPAGQGITAAPVRPEEQAEAAPAKPKSTRRKKK
jgi:glycogen operon protein